MIRILSSTGNCIFEINMKTWIIEFETALPEYPSNLTIEACECEAYGNRIVADGVIILLSGNIISCKETK